MKYRDFEVLMNGLKTHNEMEKQLNDVLNKFSFNLVNLIISVPLEDALMNLFSMYYNQTGKDKIYDFILNPENGMSIKELYEELTEDLLE